MAICPRRSLGTALGCLMLPQTPPSQTPFPRSPSLPRRGAAAGRGIPSVTGETDELASR